MKAPLIMAAALLLSQLALATPFVPLSSVGPAEASASASHTAASAPATVQVPAAEARVTLPLHILARLEQPGQVITATLRWQNKTILQQTMRTLRGADGRGLLIGSLDWTNEGGPPPAPPTQPATLELRAPSGHVLARRTVIVLSPRDPATCTIRLYWVLGEQVYSAGQRRTILRTPHIGAATLEELLWGPGPQNFAGFSTALPMPQQVLRYPGRQASWGPRVRLRHLTIVDGMATADFSRELAAYGGGSTRVRLIRQQITKTLLQFPSVRVVRIAIEGHAEGVLEP